jgi:hypothetical protein
MNGKCTNLKLLAPRTAPTAAAANMVTVHAGALPDAVGVSVGVQSAVHASTVPSVPSELKDRTAAKTVCSTQLCRQRNSAAASPSNPSPDAGAGLSTSAGQKPRQTSRSKSGRAHPVPSRKNAAAVQSVDSATAPGVSSTRALATAPVPAQIEGGIAATNGDGNSVAIAGASPRRKSRRRVSRTACKSRIAQENTDLAPAVVTPLAAAQRMLRRPSSAPALSRGATGVVAGSDPPALPRAAAASFAHGASVPPRREAVSPGQETGASGAAEDEMSPIFCTPVGTRSFSAGLTPSISLPSSATIQAACDAIDTSGLMFDVDDEDNTSYAGGDILKFLHPLNRHKQQLQERLHIHLDGEHTDQDLVASDVDGGGGSNGHSRRVLQSTPAAAQTKTMDAERAELVTPVTGFQRSSCLSDAEFGFGRLFKSRASAPLPLAMRHATPMTDARAASQSRNYVANDSSATTITAGTQLQQCMLRQIDTESPTTSMPRISLATRNHIMKWTCVAPPSPLSTSATPTRTTRGKRCFDDGNGSKSFPVQSKENMPPVEHASKRLRFGTPSTDWQKKIQQDGRICAERGEISLPNAPRIFRFRVGSGGSSRQAFREYYENVTADPNVEHSST